MVSQILTTWLVVQALGLLGLPLTAFLLRSLPDRGYAFSKSLGLLFVGYLAWLLAMLGLGSFGAPLLILSGLAVGVLGLAVQRKALRGARQTLLAWVRARWRLLVGYEALFLLALVFLALLRARTPDPWGTERPMDFALFNAIRRSESFPPHDPWLAGYSINYYYFGYLLMAAVSLLSGLEPSVAYNLSLALVFALTALGVAGLVWNLMALTSQDQAPNAKDDARAAGFRPASLILRPVFVVLSVVFVLLAGNQGGALQIITGTPSALALSGGDLWRAVGNGLGARAPLTLDRPYQEWGAAAPTSVITPEDQLANFNWWNPSRALWDGARQPGDITKFYAITEFPFFSFWLGDMHPHVMALPFGLLAAALALQTLARPAAPTYTLTARGWLELALTGIVLGSLYAINSWDFPTYLLLFLGALLLLYVRLGKGVAGAPVAQGAAPGLGGIWWRHYLYLAFLVGVAAVAMLAPFYLTFRSLVGAKEPLVNLPLLATLTRTIGFVTWGHTPLHTFLIIFGLFAVPLLGFVFASGTSLRREARAASPALPQAGGSSAGWRPELGFAAQLPALSTLEWLPIAIVVTLLVGLLIGFPLLVLLPLAAYALLLAARRSERPAEAFALLGVALGALICLGTEVVYIRDTFEGAATRMNTIFKFYYQVWLLWGTLAGFALWWVFRPRTAGSQPVGAGPARRRSFVGRWSLAVVVGALLVGALAYPWLTAGRSLRETPLVGLEGKTPRQSTPAGAAGIAWLRANTRGDEVVLESVGGAYDLSGGPGAAGVSASTGLATVLGWPGHEVQWRGGDPATLALIGPREADVDTIYSTLDVEAARAQLQRYDVAYVYVGQAERNRYTPESLDKFVQLGSAVFQQDEVTIYKVGE